MASGCDGVYVFNIEGSFLHQVAGIDPLRTKGRETIRFAADRGSGGYRPWKYLKDGGRFNNLPKIDPGEPLRVKPGETCTFEMFVAGDSLVDAPNATAKVLTNLKLDEAVAFTCNGRSFEATQPRAGVFVYALPVDALKPGMNAFSVTFPQNVGKNTTFNDFVLRIIPNAVEERPTVNSGQSQADILWTRVIAQEKGRQCSWPTVAKARDGSLVAVFSGDREAHICPWGKVQMVRSTASLRCLTDVSS